MQLEDGKRYTNAIGDVTERIMGPCAVYSDWVWTSAGNWYDRATGYPIGYAPTATGPHVRDGHYVAILANRYRLVRELSGE